VLKQRRERKIVGRSAHKRNEIQPTTSKMILRILLLVMVAILPLAPQTEAFSIRIPNTRTPKCSLSSSFGTITRLPTVLSAKQKTGNDKDDDEDDDYYTTSNQEELLPPMDLPSDERPLYSREELERLTVPQLKQQLRLRGLRVSGRKAELVHRLFDGMAGRTAATPSSSTTPISTENTEFLSAEEAAAQKVQRARELAKSTGKELVDVTAYLDEEDQGKQFKSSNTKKTPAADDDNDNDDNEVSEEEAATTEVWGAQARLGLSDENDNRKIVDSLSRTIMEFQGSNQTFTTARVFATRDALKPFLEGGRCKGEIRTTGKAEDRLHEIQTRREREAARPIRAEDTVGLDEGDENRLLTDVVLNRDYSDWGKFTATGAQLSAQEVQGVLLLTDVYGAFNEDTTVLAETIAFECQPVVVMIPDLFRGNPWTGPTDGVNEQGQTYEEWRATHSDLRVSVDIRAAAACLRETYGVSSVVVFGTCYGGGRALEAASGWFDSIHDVDGTTVGPPPVDPTVAIAWYPTRYNPAELFGAQHRGRDKTVADGSKRRMAIMGVFAENDTIPGATAADAARLKALLEEDDRVVDHMVKVFPGQEHGFAHIGLSQRQTVLQDDDLERFVDEEFGGTGRLSVADGEAEVACLLSTAFMETYSRVFLPTVGPPISLDEQEVEWGKQLGMKDLNEFKDRDIRSEIQDAIENFVEEPLQSGPRIDPTDKDQEEQLMELLRSMEDPSTKGPLKIENDDDLATIYGKLTSSDENFQIF